MYRNYFGLSSLPFKTTPDPEFFYQQGSRQDTLNALYYAIERGDAILKVVGEVGCGKTMLLRLLASKLSVENTCYTLLYINSPNLSSKDILLYIASELGLVVEDSAQKFVILNLIKMHILSIYAAGGRVVMLVDEAQTMTLDGLEEIRLLSNFETDEDKLLQIVLFGQPELDVALENAHIRQLKSRISYSLYIPAFTVIEVQAYLNFRLRKAHYSGLDLFNLSVSKRIFKLTHGLPRDINILADKLLMAAYGANDTVVKHSHFKSASDASISKRFVIGISAAFLILLLTVIFFSLKHFSNHQSPGLVDSLKGSIDSWLNPSIPDNSSTILDNEALHQPIELAGIVSTETPVLQEPAASRADNKGESDALSESSKLEPVLMDSILPKVAESGGLGLSYDDLLALIKEHVSTQEWLATLPSEAYVIQLSTIRVNGALSVMDKLKTDSLINPLFIRVLLDYNQGQNHYRVKVLYFDSMSHPGLVTRIESLPAHLKVSKPYIASVRHILSKLEFTQTQLKQDGIINVNP